MSISPGRLAVSPDWTPQGATDITSSVLYYNLRHKGNVFQHPSGSMIVAPTSFSLAGLAANSAYDVFMTALGGIYVGPAWSVSQPTFVQRGLTQVGGYLLNAAGDPLLGSIQIDATAGQVTVHMTPGPSRRCGISNVYNREPFVLIATDLGASRSIYLAIDPVWTALNSGANVSVLNTLPAPVDLEQILNTWSLSGVQESSPQGRVKHAIGWNSQSVPFGSYSVSNIEVFSAAADIGFAIKLSAKADIPAYAGVGKAWSLGQTRVVTQGGNQVALCFLGGGEDAYSLRWRGFF